MASETLGIVNGTKLEAEIGPTDCFIDDEHFMRDLKRLKDLRSFLMQEAVNIIPDDDPTVLSFGKLNQLRLRASGRAPNLDEWLAVERHTQSLFRLLSEPLRRRFILGGTPMWVATLPLGLALVALFALFGAVSLTQPITSWILLCYLVWLVCLGAIGSVGSIGMNALSVQQDTTFDLSNQRLMVLRIALGALFGLVLTLPFGFQYFFDFVAAIHSAQPSVLSGADSKTLTTQALSLLLPFVLGFSTSLVLMILNRLIDAVQAFFGKMGTNEAPVVGSKQSVSKAR
jgi:hypothetical protein